jgi:hypothetical protein
MEEKESAESAVAEHKALQAGTTGVMQNMM